MPQEVTVKSHWIRTKKLKTCPKPLFSTLWEHARLFRWLDPKSSRGFCSHNAFHSSSLSRATFWSRWEALLWSEGAEWIQNGRYRWQPGEERAIGLSDKGTQKTAWFGLGMGWMRSGLGNVVDVQVAASFQGQRCLVRSGITTGLLCFDLQDNPSAFCCLPSKTKCLHIFCF